MSEPVQTMVVYLPMMQEDYEAGLELKAALDTHFDRFSRIMRGEDVEPLPPQPEPPPPEASVPTVNLPPGVSILKNDAGLTIGLRGDSWMLEQVKFLEDTYYGAEEWRLTIGDVVLSLNAVGDGYEVDGTSIDVNLVS